MSNEALVNRTPPHDVKAEQAVLGAIFLNNGALDAVLQYLTPRDFYRRAHQYIFAAMIKLSGRSERIDAVTLPDYLRATHRLADVGGIKYISSLVTLMPTAANVEDYAKIVKNKAITRRLISTANTIARAGYTQSENVDDLLNNAENRILNVAQQRVDSGFQPIKQVVSNAYDKVHQLSRNHSSVTGLATGYPAIDKKTTGFHDGEFVVIAARPAMGKTTFAVNIAQHVATKTNGSVAIFSLEMGAESLVDRMICSVGNINAQHLRTGQLTDDEWRGLAIAVNQLSRIHVYIDDTPGINISLILARARRLSKEKKNLKLVVVDYLQLVEGNDRENRQQEVSEVSRQLKKLAKELDVPVIALSQLSRGVEQREDKRPVLSDIRESGSIEQDADIVAFLYRKDYYQHDQNDDHDDKVDNGASDTEFIIGKNRSGPQGTVHLMFIKAYNKFAPISPQRPVDVKRDANGNF